MDNYSQNNNTSIETSKSKLKSSVSKKEVNNILKNDVYSTVWLSVSEAAKIGGVTTKTIRRALQSNRIKYKIIKNRYLIDLASIIIFLQTKTKLKNKLNQYGIGQYIEKWRE
jgi:hypothetical protein